MVQPARQDLTWVRGDDYSVTLTMTTSYLGQARTGTLTCKATKRGGGNTIFMATGEIRDESGKLIAIGEGTFRYIADKAR